MAVNGHLSKLTDEQLRDTVEKLKRIEQRASAVLAPVTKDLATFNKRVYAEIERRKALIQKDAKREISDIYEQTRQATSEKSAQLKREYEDKKKSAAENFSANREAWRKAIFKNILSGI